MLRPKPNKDGKFPIVVRITKDRKSTFLYSGYYIDRKFWDDKNKTVKKSYPNSTRLNNLLIGKLAEANKTLIELQSNDKVVSSKQIKKEIINPLTKKSFNELSEIYKKELLDNNKLTRLSADKSRIKHFIEFADSDNINFREIDEEFLRRFTTFLRVMYYTEIG